MGMMQVPLWAATKHDVAPNTDNFPGLTLFWPFEDANDAEVVTDEVVAATVRQRRSITGDPNDTLLDAARGGEAGVGLVIGDGSSYGAQISTNMPATISSGNVLVVAVANLELAQGGQGNRTELAIGDWRTGTNIGCGLYGSDGDNKTASMYSGGGNMIAEATSNRSVDNELLFGCSYIVGVGGAGSVKSYIDTITTATDSVGTNPSFDFSTLAEYSQRWFQCEL